MAHLDPKGIKSKLFAPVRWFIRKVWEFEDFLHKKGIKIPRVKVRIK